MKKRKKQRLSNFDLVKIIIALMVLIVSVGVLGDEAGERYVQQKKFQELRGKSLLDLYEKNNELVGWIKVPGTKINYPVMRGEKYLHKNFDGEYSIAGTPFVYDDWTPNVSNSLIFGHNMIDRTMFADIHKYEKKDFWKKHKKVRFWVICENTFGEKYVEERVFKIRNVMLVSTEGEFDWTSYSGITTPSVTYEYLDKCDANDLYDTGVEKEENVITLCTCSYHIRGNRDAGRILLTGVEKNRKNNEFYKTEKKSTTHD